MKLFNFTKKAALLLVLMLPLIAFSNDTQNHVDEKGLRQGYWVITGEMAKLHAYDKSSVVEEGEYLDNKKIGEWKKYWPNGKMQNQIAYVNGQPEGNYTVYYRNGKIEEQGTWIDGMNVGEFKRFYENGNPQQEFTFLESGKRNGVQKYYYENGQLELEANFKQGNEEGAFVRYNENGTVKERMEMSNGSVKAGTQKKYSRTTNNQTVKADSDAKEAPKATDKTNKSYEFDPNGYNTLYNRDLQKTQVGDFRNGKLWDGKWYRYDESGILEKIEIYKEGKFVGTGVLEE